LQIVKLNSINQCAIAQTLTTDRTYQSHKLSDHFYLLKPPTTVLFIL